MTRSTTEEGYVTLATQALKQAGFKTEKAARTMGRYSIIKNGQVVGQFQVALMRGWNANNPTGWKLWANRLEARNWRAHDMNYPFTWGTRRYQKLDSFVKGVVEHCVPISDIESRRDAAEKALEDARKDSRAAHAELKHWQQQFGNTYGSLLADYFIDRNPMTVLEREELESALRKLRDCQADVDRCTALIEERNNERLDLYKEEK